MSRLRLVCSYQISTVFLQFPVYTSFPLTMTSCQASCTKSTCGALGQNAFASAPTAAQDGIRRVAVGHRVAGGRLLLLTGRRRRQPRNTCKSCISYPVRVKIHIHIHIPRHTHIHVLMHKHIHVRMHKYVYIYIYMCVYVFAYVEPERERELERGS